MRQCGNNEMRCKLDKQATCSCAQSFSLSVVHDTKAQQTNSSNSPERCSTIATLTEATCNTVYSGEKGEGATLVALCSHLILAIVFRPYYDAHSTLSWPNVVDSKFSPLPLHIPSIPSVVQASIPFPFPFRFIPMLSAIA